MELAEETRAVFLGLGLVPDTATVGINLGIIHSRLGRMPEAEAVLREVLVGLLAIGDELGAAKAHSNLGQLYQQQDRLAEAVGELETALGIFRRHGQTQLEAGTSLNLALLYRKEGRLTAALELLDRVRRAYRDETHPDAVFAGLEESRKPVPTSSLTCSTRPSGWPENWWGSSRGGGWNSNRPRPWG